MRMYTKARQGAFMYISGDGGRQGDGLTLSCSNGG